MTQRRRLIVPDTDPLEALMEMCRPFGLAFSGPDKEGRYTATFVATGRRALHQVWFRDCPGGPAEVIRGYFTNTPNGRDPADRSWRFGNHPYALTKAGHVRLQDALARDEFVGVFKALAP